MWHLRFPAQLTPIYPSSPWLTCDVPLSFIGALLIWVSWCHTLGWVFSIQAHGHGPRQPLTTYTVHLWPYVDPSTSSSHRHGGNRWTGLGSPGPCLAGAELPIGPLITSLAVLVQSVITGVGWMRWGWHQAGAGEICVGQELRLLVQGERGLLVLQITPRDTWVRVPHATPNRATRMSTPHAAAGWLIHSGANILYTVTYESKFKQDFVFISVEKTPLSW